MRYAKEFPIGSSPSALRLLTEGKRIVWRSIAVAIAVCCLLVIREGHLKNHSIEFFGGLAGLLSFSAIWLQVECPFVAHIGWMVWQRVAALALMLTIIEAGYQTVKVLPESWRNSRTAPVAQVMTFEEAQGDPAAFAIWWNEYAREWHRGAEKIQEATPQLPVPYVFKPYSSRPFFGGTISINGLGLSDREVPREKGNKFRIVVMGSSHTQCPPMEASDTPWPAKLEQRIRDEISSDQDIEVLNAGASGYTMEENLYRLKEVVLPLKPNMIITYFGYNEYELFRNDFPRLHVPPKQRARPSELLGKLEWNFAKWLSAQRPSISTEEILATQASRLERGRIARLYQEYLRITRENGIQLVVCNFNMAVDRNSPADVIRFYEQGFPSTRFLIQANELHSALLPRIFPEQSGARWIDVQTGLNGVWNRDYLDLVHLSESGKAKLAENVQHGIRDLLPASRTPGSPRQLANHRSRSLLKNDDHRDF